MSTRPFATVTHTIANDASPLVFAFQAARLAVIAEVAKETSGYYLVSYRAEHLTGLRGFQKVEVRLANPELKVTARKGYRFGD